MRRVREAAIDAILTFVAIIRRNTTLAVVTFLVCGFCVFAGGWHITAERDIVPMGPFEPWHLQDDVGVPARIQVAMLGAAVIALLTQVGRSPLLAGWAIIHAVFAIALLTRFQDDLVDDTRVAAALIGGVLITLAIALIVAGRTAVFTTPLGVATIALIAGGGVLDRVHWALSTTSLEGPLNLLEGAWELFFVGLILVVAIDLARHPAD